MQYLGIADIPMPPFFFLYSLETFKKNIFYYDKAKPVDQREHRIRPKLVDISAYKKRDIPQLKEDI